MDFWILKRQAGGPNALLLWKCLEIVQAMNRNLGNAAKQIFDLTHEEWSFSEGCSSPRSDLLVSWL